MKVEMAECVAEREDEAEADRNWQSTTWRVSMPGVSASVAAGCATLAEPAELRLRKHLQQFYVGERYLRLIDAHSYAPVNAVVPLLCRGCGATLTYTDQLLCVKRRWGCGSGWF